MDLKVGDKVLSDWYPGEEDVIRTITRVGEADLFPSGYVVSADGGGECPHCKRPYGKTIPLVDSGWFKKA